MVVDVNIDERVPHMVKDLVHIRLEFECPYVEEPEGSAGLVCWYGI